MPGAPELEVGIRTKIVSAPGGGTRAVLRDVRFAARPGEFLALFAPSGTGKTTILRVVLGLDRAFSGNVRRPEGRVGVVFQEPRLVPWLTVAENLRLVTSGQLSDPDIDALLDEVGLSGTAQRRPGALSLGMARRVALVRALAVDPAFLVLDEPFASLDPQLAARLAGVTSGWARRKAVTVLLATHDLDQALSIADRILILAGTPATLAADVSIPDRGDAQARGVLRGTLREQFPFLAAVPSSD